MFVLRFQASPALRRPARSANPYILKNNFLTGRFPGMPAQTLFEKIWNPHVVHQSAEQPALLYIDLHLVHEVTSPQAFEGLMKTGRKVRCQERTFATMDHNVPTTDRSLPITDPDSKLQIEMMRKNCAHFGVRLYDLGSREQGIVHVIG